ncbi:hypothetical protein C2G38_2206484 [Gigaspora rosea]|uniref:Uncharacterized protein n=1 Tax=Gigaspora rosea TaxID=44941 RepID=A0A397UNE6_9GLOM|nr:hypothetical protein C2G38_2206484 [Gigaspora rosea]
MMDIDPINRQTAAEICDIFAEWQNSEIILLELFDSDEKLQNMAKDDTQIYLDSYKSSFIPSTITLYKSYSDLDKWEMPDVIDEIDE